MILNDDGKLVWYLRRPWVGRDLKVVRYRGRPMLAFFQAVSPQSVRQPYYALVNDRYRIVRRIRAGHGYRINTHDLQLTPRGTAYISAYHHVWYAQLATRVTEYVIQELDLATGRVLFEWHSLDHVPPVASYLARPSDGTPWDYFHGNSIDISARPTLLVSARNTSAVYAVSRRTGRILWTLGGKQDEFGIVRRHPRWQFCAQHDARWLPNGDLSLFDDGGRALWAGRACPVHLSRVEQFRLDARARTARLVRTISSRPSSESGRGFSVWAEGSARRLPNGSMLVDWGTAGRITEVARDGDVRFGLRLARYSYRAVRAPWVGRPASRPRLATSCTASRLRLWVSWNGATRVRAWRVLAGRSRLSLVPERVVSFRGLETSITFRTRPDYVRAVALGSARRVLGRSRIAATRCA